MNKKAMQLSINMLVVIIIGLVLFAAGMFLVKNISSEGGEVMKQVDARLQKQLQQTCFLDGRAICVLDPKAKVNRGDNKMFAFGFMNNLGETANFTVIVKSANAWDIFTSANGYSESQAKEKANQMILHTLQIGEVKLDANEEKFIWIRFTPPNDAPAGQYLYDIYVCSDKATDPNAVCASYKLYTGTKQRLFITVV